MVSFFKNRFWDFSFILLKVVLKINKCDFQLSLGIVCVYMDACARARVCFELATPLFVMIFMEIAMPDSRFYETFNFLTNLYSRSKYRTFFVSS